jgi:copper chaperone CopZ
MAIGGGGGVPLISPAGGNANVNVNVQPIDMKGRCVPGKIDIPGLVQQVSSAATQLAHRGINLGVNGSSSRNHDDPSKYGDPQVTPVVLVTTNQTTGAKDVQFYMTIEGITCAHCVKIVETVLKGCPGSRSPIEGLLDAASDLDSSFVIIKIENIEDCRRIAWESARNLSMVGYTAKAKSYIVPNGMSLENAYSLMEQTIPSYAPMMGFRWDLHCECPDNNVSRYNCPRLV